MIAPQKKPPSPFAPIFMLFAIIDLMAAVAHFFDGDFRAAGIGAFLGLIMIYWYFHLTEER